MDVGGVVGAHRRGDLGVLEQPLLDRHLFARADAHQHDVDEALADDLGDLVAEIGERARFAAERVDPGRGQAVGHVCVLGIGKDEVACARRIGVDVRELGVE